MKTGKSSRASCKMTSLADALTELEAQPNRVDKKPLEADSFDRLLEFVKKTGGLPVTLDCRSKILTVSNDDLVEVITPLCTWLKTLAEVCGCGVEEGRLFVGIIGAAAAGKSALAQLLCAASSVLWDVSRVQCVSMDGYSFPNSYLAAEPGVDHLGRPCTLKDIKGLPRTLDVDKFSSDLRRLHRPNGEAVLLPVYDRDLHDPVQEGVAIVPGCQIVIVEDGQWKDISTALHRTVFLDIERSCCFERVVGRKVLNGRSRESSEAHFSRVDGPTFDQLQKEKSRADLVLTLRPTEDRPLRVIGVEARVPRSLP